MESVPFLAPERKTTVEVNFVAPILDFIRQNYAGNAATDHEAAVNAVNKLRDDVRHSQEKTDRTKALYIRLGSPLMSGTTE